MSPSDPELDVVHVGEEAERAPSVELTSVHGGHSINVTIKGTISVQLPELTARQRNELVRSIRRVVIRGSIADLDLAEQVIYQHLQNLQNQEPSAGRIVECFRSVRLLLENLLGRQGNKK